jgi:uncharacterized protein
MLRLDLSRLDREGTLQLDARVPPDDDLWKEMEVGFAEPVEVGLTATIAGSGEVVVRGTIRASIEQECRRCLEPIGTEFEEDVTWVFVAAEDPESVEVDDEVRFYEPGAGELDLSYAVREEIILNTDRYVVCDPECKGLCPKCGTNLNEGECDCTFDEPDPRWDALRSLKKE